MGWSIGFEAARNRDIGYGVPAYCDHPECTEKIDRGLGYVCGGDAYGGEHGCGLFFCSTHLHMAGSRRDNKPLCVRCLKSRPLGFAPKPDHPEWVEWKLTDDSWKQWRGENPDEVARMRAAVTPEAQDA